MLATLQRILMRALALIALAAGALVAMFLALFTLISGILIGAVTLILARFGRGPLGPLGRRASQPPGQPSNPSGTVIDVDMREIRPDENGAGPAGDKGSRSTPAA